MNRTHDSTCLLTLKKRSIAFAVIHFRHYGFLHKLVWMIRLAYESCEYQSIHNNKLIELFEIKTGVKQ